MGRQPLATVDEVCEYFQISKQTLYNWRTAGAGPRARKVGGQLRFDWRDVEAFGQSGSRAA